MLGAGFHAGGLFAVRSVGRGWGEYLTITFERWRLNRGKGGANGK